MNHSMYKSEDINSENPVEVENNLSKFEQVVAPIFKRLCMSGDIVLTRRELETLRIFLSLLSFRSDLRMKQYKEKRFNQHTKDFLEDYKGDQDFELFWKKEINALAKCRTFEDVMALDDVDQIIKLDFHNDLKGYYMTLVEARGQDFIISDVYPTLEIFPVSDDINLHLHAFYPISPTRCIVLNHICFLSSLRDRQDPLFGPMVSFSQISNQMLKEPRHRYKVNRSIFTPEDEFIYSPTKIYENDVVYINTLFLNETRNGFAFRNIERILSSIKKYNSNYREYNKNNYDSLESKLEELLND